MARVLVVDDDPWTQRMVSAVLSQAGHLVDLASDGWEALIRAGRARPDVVISELKLPTTDGWRLAQALRNRPESPDIPFIFLASLRSERAPGPAFRPEMDQMLPKPFRLEQLEDAVGTALSRVPPRRVTPRGMPAVGASGRPAAPPPRTPPGRAGETETGRRTVLSGSLEEFGLSSLLIVLELERKSGVVILRNTQTAGRIYLRQGRVVRAQIEGSDRRGQLAVYDLLGWLRGRFEFNVGEVSGDDEIGSSTSFLLLESARLQDERDHDKDNN
jgi:two-component system OmpR family response regulator